ncbi:hypothetical protein SODALDRAFT_381507 [Sodiomyces alkalinus F11]|uniref:Uncharacterized protein n=1 Tax=Sodiomyces alkalinus (strain CBS 110278 / VKM F-3762 / F11) TaxID=1314773 RepID=A0A3N2PLD3_SODAK|nr:hypothetical protein SODALDRAFT_381507 [Sodiomyces alkalinus F11]ROT35333.1 hypothetical protein SODALDRAFT_381507 [Sodiomyces alkalinus F11]
MSQRPTPLPPPSWDVASLRLPLPAVLHDVTSWEVTPPRLPLHTALSPQVFSMKLANTNFSSRRSILEGDDERKEQENLPFLDAILLPRVASPDRGKKQAPVFGRRDPTVKSWTPQEASFGWPTCLVDLLQAGVRNPWLQLAPIMAKSQGVTTLQLSQESSPTVWCA